MRYFIKLSYNGSLFHGWQSQPNAVSVQQTIEEAMSVILRGAGQRNTAPRPPKTRQDTPRKPAI